MKNKMSLGETLTAACGILSIALLLTFVGFGVYFYNCELDRQESIVKASSYTIQIGWKSYWANSYDLNGNIISFHDVLRDADITLVSDKISVIKR